MENLSYCQNTVNKTICVKAAKLAKADCLLKISLVNMNICLAKLALGYLEDNYKTRNCKSIGNERKIIILDEPTSNLDEKNSNEILNTLSSINKKTKATIIIISHKIDIMQISNNLIKL